MKAKPPNPNAPVVFVVGAGLSKDFGYPLTRDLLFGISDRLRNRDKVLWNSLKRIVQFHHPTWDERPAHLPDIEEFLTEVSANQDLLPELRPSKTLGATDLSATVDRLLVEIARWFHERYEKKSTHQLGVKAAFVSKLRKHRNTVVISFNWDLELDSELFGPHPENTGGGYGVKNATPPLILLKPHGSLNWFSEKSGTHLSGDVSELLWKSKTKVEAHWDNVYCFRKWREPRTKHDRLYVPWIVPPTHLKSFEHPMLQAVWRRAVDALSHAKKIYFVGYSMPAADWHSRYIFRAGFQNQHEGVRSRTRGKREPRREPSAVTIVNPDNASFRRIEAVVGYRCKWVPLTTAEWLVAKR